jgi:hypothetical protein
MLPLIFRVEEQAKQGTSMKQVASIDICLPKARVYIGNRRDPQGNLSVHIGLLTEQSEPIGDKTRITSVGPEKGCKRGEWERSRAHGL